MDRLCSYQVRVRNGLDERAFNASSPLQLRVVGVDPEATLLCVVADQAGLVGLVRHLHQQGYVLLSVSRDEWSAAR